MAILPKSENLTLITQNVIPDLAETVYENQVTILANGNPAVPGTEYTVSGKVITWDEVTAGYDLEVGNVVNADYHYDDGVPAVPPEEEYDSSDSGMNPVSMSYDMIVAEEDVVPSLIHVPVASSLTVSVNSISTTEGVEWTRIGKVLTWISVTTLSVGAVVSVSYRKNV